MEKYNTYLLDDFLDDLTFVEHLKYPSDRQTSLWKSWRETNPPSGDSYDEAVQIMRIILSLERVQVPVGLEQDLLLNIKDQIQVNQQRKVRRLRQRWSVVAAAVVLFIGMSVLWFSSSSITVATGNGELQTVVLPDSSIVQLNANSSISYKRAWSWTGNRTVYSKGEVLFDVKHLHGEGPVQEGQQFTVHSGRAVITVLGTKFNVKNRNNRVRVSLLEGKIRLADRENTNDIRYLHAGDQILVDATGFSPIRAVSDITSDISWRSQHLVAQDLSVRALIAEYQYVFGRKIVMTDTAWLNKRIDGKISMKSPESLIYTLTNILQADVRQVGATTYLTPKQ